MELKIVNKYVKLVNKLMWIMDHSGVSWDPKYAREAEQIRKELKELRPIIEEARRAKGGEDHAQKKAAEIPDPERHLPADRRDSAPGYDRDHRRL